MTGSGQKMSSNTPKRAGPRSKQRRGPQPARSAQRDALKEQIDRIVDDKGSPLSERHLLNYRTHFPEEASDYDYFRMTRAIVTAARRWRKVANDRVKPLEQTMARWETLFLVAFADGEVTQSELARLISVEGPTMVRMLDVLARDGLIERRQSETDARVTTNRITPAGTSVITEIMAVTNQLRSEVLGGIDPGEMSVALKVLNQILRKLDELR